MEIPKFKGREKIAKLSTYPIQWDPQPQSVEDSLVRRGHEWSSIPPVHHMQYTGLAFGGSTKCNVQSRIMVDRGWPLVFIMELKIIILIRSAAILATFSSLKDVPRVSRTVKVFLTVSDSCAQPEDFDTLLYASPVLYGFNLTEKRWLQFNVRHVCEIKWNDNIFKHLILDQNTKTVLRGLIEAHAQDRPFDDFVEGKGLGLVVNLFGPPGVGKSLTVEAISEHLRRPLYVAGAGDLGTEASTVDDRLKRILALVPKWNAILVIDEADVFLEKRSTHDLKRNAIVAVFLREIEYFRGILFLTTNRAKEFDHAFQSRIHLSLHYKGLNPETRTQLWTAFLNKACDNPYGGEEISSEEMNYLARQKLNGRQIKNVDPWSRWLPPLQGSRRCQLDTSTLYGHWI
ncbi:P-loop containing nucleoside triphosphate hydrolase protein [Amanita muscaria]